MNSEPLDQLRDIHLPEIIGWWPLAPGWWMLALLLLALVSAGIFYLITKRQSLLFSRQAKQLLSQLWLAYQQNKDDRRFLEALLNILQRAHRTVHSPGSSETITTERLLSSVDECCDRALNSIIPASKIPVSKIYDLLYRRDAEALGQKEAQLLYDASHKWLSRGAK